MAFETRIKNIRMEKKSDHPKEIYKAIFGIIPVLHGKNALD